MNNAYLESIAEGAVQGWLDNKVLPSLTMAQGALESGWGQSRLAKAPYYNNFGIKWTEQDKGKYDFVLMDTKEWFNNQWITVKAPFRVYKNISDSVKDHAEFFTSTEWRKNNYKHVIGEKDYVKACQAVQKSGYATDPNYADKLIKIIEQYKLTQYDHVAFSREKNGRHVQNNQTNTSVPTQQTNQSQQKHLVICGHGQSNVYDPGAINRQLGYKEAELVRELADEMSKYSQSIKYIKDKNVYAYGSLVSDSKGYDTVTELHFNAFNSVANGTEVLIHTDYEADDMDKRILSVLTKYFKNRGFKRVNNILNVNIARNNNINYRLVEICFIDNNADIEKYKKNVQQIAKELVQAIENTSVQNTKTQVETPKSVQVEKKVEAQETKVTEKNGVDKVAHYTVKPKDTLWKIANEHGLTVEKLKSINGLKNDLIVQGQILKVTEDDIPVDSSESIPTDGIEKMIQWFQDRLGKVSYSMANRNGPYSYDCSSAVYSALKYAGFKTRISYLGNTETLFKEKGYLLREISRSEIRRGDIFVSGTEGASLGSFGHTGIVYSPNQIIHCTYPKNGIAITPIDGWTGSPTRWFRIASTEKVQQTVNQQASVNYGVTSKNGVEQVVLPAEADRWRVYPIDSTYTVGEEVGFILPSRYGGLTYDILGWQTNNVVKIQTESYGVVCIYVGADTGAKIVKKPNLSTDKVERTQVNVNLQVVNEKGTIAKFATKYLSGNDIPENVKGNTYTIIGKKKVEILQSRLAYNIQELNEWVLEQDIVESYGKGNTTFYYNSERYPGTFGLLFIGQDVKIRPNADRFVDGNVITDFDKERQYRVLGVEKCEMSYSQYAYRLSGLNGLVLEQDIIEAWEFARAGILVDVIRQDIPEQVESDNVDSEIVFGIYDNNNWKDMEIFDEKYVVRSDSIKIGYLNIDGEPIKNSYLIGHNEYSGVGVFGDLLLPLNAIKFNVPKDYEYRALVKDIGFTRWTKTGYVGNKDTIITEIHIRKTIG